jgi:hypothetical protein
MHILIGLVIATALIIMWFHGGLFACVFLSIVPGAFLLLCIVETFAGNMGNLEVIWALGCAGLLAGIWAPRLFRLQAKAPRPD